jgi:uncharacterized protein YoxC
MATLRETVNLADQLTELTQQLHGELTDGDVDFDKMIRIADEISAQADQLAAAFERVNEALSEPLEQVENGQSSQSGSASGQGSRSRSTSRSRTSSRSRSGSRKRSSSGAGRSSS